MFQQGLLLGSSVLVGSLQLVFFSNSSYCLYCFNGLYAVYIGGGLSYFLSAEVIGLFKRYPSFERSYTLLCISLNPLAFFVGGASVNANSVALLYIGLTVLLGISFSVYDVFTRLQVLLWWAPTGEKNVGVAIVGSAAGASAIFFTLFSGWVINGASLQVCLYVIGALMLFLSAYLILMIRGGKLEMIPSPDVIAMWMKEDENIGEDTPPISPPPNPTSTPIKPGCSPHVPTVVMSRCGGNHNRSPFSHSIYYPLVFFTFNVVFLGYATKVLLSSMFTLIFNLSESTSAYLSALSLVFFALGRALIPYYLLDSYYSSLFLSLMSYILCAITYVLIPTIIGSDIYTTPAFSWRLFFFVCAKCTVGLVFALNQSLAGSMIVDMVGVKNVGVFFTVIWPTAAFASVAGPVICFVITYNRYYGGMSFAESFHLFFYISAGLACINVGLLTYMIKVNQRAKRSESVV